MEITIDRVGKGKINSQQGFGINLWNSFSTKDCNLISLIHVIDTLAIVTNCLKTQNSDIERLSGIHINVGPFEFLFINVLF